MKRVNSSHYRQSMHQQNHHRSKIVFDYFQENSDAFMTEDKAVFKYIDIDKFDLIKSISINESISLGLLYYS